MSEDKSTRGSRTEYVKKLRAERRSKGLCQCGRPRDSELLTCGQCREHVRTAFERNAKKYYQANKQRRAKHQGGGKCRCGKTPASGRKLCVECLESCKRVSEKKYVKRRASGLCMDCGEKAVEGMSRCQPCRERAAEYHRQMRARVMDAYGRVCACCGECQDAFLTVDHVHNDGSTHRKTLRPRSYRSGRGGHTAVYRDIIKRGFPADFQVLCMNCNWGKARNGGVCPHQRMKCE